MLELGIPSFVLEARLSLPCRSAADDFFVPDAQAGPAKRLCATCLFLEPCAAYGLERTGLRGIWGGLTERERRTVRRRSGGDRGPPGGAGGGVGRGGGPWGWMWPGRACAHRVTGRADQAVTGGHGEDH
ncbi:WhiB family transcriptional regulator [Streptomyces sp. NPDC058252]|uniref:WhiB family transcriptional regulator n=1 Tax=Streptomyces sp. NPDC058252 TaxID=3346405 RepID=UPI0036E6A2EC